LQYFWQATGSTAERSGFDFRQGWWFFSSPLSNRLLGLLQAFTQFVLELFPYGRVAVAWS
jgi:hypothetical protein